MTMQRARQNTRWVPALAALLLPASASGQPAVPPAPFVTATSGLVLPNPSAAAADDVLAIEQNPAALNGMQGAEGTFLFVDADDDRPNAGAGFFFGLPLGGFWWPAASVQWLDRNLLVPRSATKASLASAFGTRSVAFGVSYNLFESADPALDELSTWDLGLVTRPWRWVSLGAVARNAGGADLGAVDLPTVWDLGVALRPFTWRVTFNTDVLLSDDPDGQNGVLREYRFGIRLWPHRSIQLQASAGINAQGWTTAGFLIGFTQEHLSVAGAPIQDIDEEFDNAYVWVRADVHSATRDPLVRFRRDQAVALGLAGRYPELKAGGLFAPEEQSFSELLASLRRLERDDRIGTLLVRVNGPEIGLAQAEELRQALLRLRQRGKRVLVHLEEADDRTYHLASVADRISMTPGASLTLLGYAATFTYLRDALDVLRVRPDFVRIGRYKSAPNLFTADRMAPEEREMEQSLLDDPYRRLVHGIAQQRKKSPAEVERLIDRGPYLAEGAREAGLVDSVEHYAEIEERLRKEGVRFFGGYFSERRYHPDWGRLPRIAIVHVSGVIAAGRSSPVPLFGSQVAGAQTLGETLDRAAADASVRAIVLRIDSPGGSATAAETIHHHVAEAAKKKPVIVSMGGVAASGGYYVAAPGSYIFADPSTLTGSIGIFTGKFDVSGLLGWLGVQRTTLKRGERADLYGPDRPFTEEEREALQRMLQQSYDLFVRRVADGRHLSVEQVEAVAQGRVWTGEQARERKLVDALGGLDEALAEARRRSGLSHTEEVELVELPETGGLGLGLPLAATAGSLLPGRAATPPAEQAGMAQLVRRLGSALGWVPAALHALAPGEPLALMEMLVEVR